MKSVRMSFFSPLRITLSLVLLLVIAVLSLVLYLNGKNVAVLNPQGVIADKQLELIVFTTLLGMVVIIPVFIMLFYFAWKYRASNKRAKYTPKASGNHLLEAIWWGIPIIIISILSVVTWVSSHDLDPYKPLSSQVKPIKVQVVALQWRWLFIYPELGVASMNELRFPEKTPIDFQITADAPMSAFWIPNLGSQIYAMNGMTSKLSLEADRVGSYRGSNSNISGEGYADMHFQAIAMTTKDFNQWVKTAAGSNKHLDRSTYGEIVKATRNREIIYYMLHDKSLYYSVLAKYMDHSSMSGNDSGTMDMNHEGIAH